LSRTYPCERAPQLGVRRFDSIHSQSLVLFIVCVQFTMGQQKKNNRKITQQKGNEKRIANHRYGGIATLVIVPVAVALFHINYGSITQADRRNNADNNYVSSSCQLVMAKSTVPDGGFGMFALSNIQSNHPVVYGEPVIQLVNITQDRYPGISYLLHRYAWSGEATGGQHEGASTYSIIPGISMLANSRSEGFNAVPNLPVVHHHGLVRGMPEAGAGTHYHGWRHFATRHIHSNEELFVDYGTAWEGKIRNDFTWTTSRPTSELRQQGICLDNLKPAVTEGRGHGAFATRSLSRGAVIAPLPLLSIDRRSLDLPGNRKQLLLNYCFGHPKSSVLLFAYAPVVNLLNHNGENANAELRWSGRMLDPESWFQLTAAAVKARQESGLMLELLATRNIAPGEEVRISYGQGYDRAWKDHVEKHGSLSDHEKQYGARNYEYSFDANAHTAIFRTVAEQLNNPYPSNLETSCYYPYTGETTITSSSSRRLDEATGMVETTVQWHQGIDVFRPQFVRPCKIMERKDVVNDKSSYTVQILNGGQVSGMASIKIPSNERYIVTNVPREALLFTDRLSSSDQHHPHAFRHEIGLPDGVFPESWMDL
jgi:SET domain